jgi:hypothetical protein
MVNIAYVRVLNKVKIRTENSYKNKLISDFSFVSASYYVSNYTGQSTDLNIYDFKLYFEIRE